MPDKRKFVRRPASGQINVTDRTDDKIIGSILDLSQKGISIKTQKSYPIRSYLWCRIDLPENILDGRQITFDAEIKRNRPADENGTFEIGCELRNISREDKKTLESLIYLLMAKHLDSFNNKTVVIKKK